MNKEKSNTLEQLRTLKTLIDNKKELEKELKNIDKQMKEKQKNCNHIVVCLGYDGLYQYRDTSFCTCLLCEKEEPNSNYKIINATKFKEPLYGNGETYKNRARRLKEVQNVALRISRKNPEITEIELIEEITDVIKKDVTTQKQTQTKAKQLTRK